MLSVREEMRRNLIAKLASDTTLFPGIIGYDDSVVPEIENAILAGHHMVFLGERGQAKSRIIRGARRAARRGGARRRRLRDQRRSDRARSAARAAGGSPRPGDALPIAWLPRERALRREARHARRLDGRPHRRDRSRQGRRGALPRRRGDDPLRAHPAHEPRHLRHQRAAGPDREGAGRPLQPDGGEGRPDQRLQGPPAARRRDRRERQPRGLHQPRPHHHAAEGPLRRPDPHALPADDRGRDRDHGAGGVRCARAASPCACRRS